MTRFFMYMFFVRCKIALSIFIT